MILQVWEEGVSSATLVRKVGGKKVGKLTDVAPFDVLGTLVSS